jgi:hypothetical protein
MKQWVKTYQYKTIIISDRGHLDDPGLLLALNEAGLSEINPDCPRCGIKGHAVAHGWKHKEDQPKGANKLAILVEREVEIDEAACETVNATTLRAGL